MLLASGLGDVMADNEIKIERKVIRIVSHASLERKLFLSLCTYSVIDFLATPGSNDNGACCFENRNLGL